MKRLSLQWRITLMTAGILTTYYGVSIKCIT